MLLWLLAMGLLLLGDYGFGYSGRSVGRPKGLAGDGYLGAMVNKNLFMRVPAVGGRRDNFNAVALQLGDHCAEGCRMLVKDPVQALANGHHVVGAAGSGLPEFFI